MSMDRGRIDLQLRQIGEGERWWEQREFRELPYILHDDETIRGIINGRLLGPRRPRLLRGVEWLLVATDQRLICLKQERFGRKQIDITASQITRIREATRLRSHQITIDTPVRRYRIRIPKADAFRFVGALAPLVPTRAVPALPADLSALSWVPGLSTVATLPVFSGVVSRIALLSPPEYATLEQVERLEATVDRLTADVDRLQQQVRFLEDLLEKRSAEAVLTPGRGGT